MKPSFSKDLSDKNVNLVLYFFLDGVDARKPDYTVSRSERSALVSNQAAEHELRVALRSINNMKHAAAQAHDHQRYKFLGSLSDDIFGENIAA